MTFQAALDELNKLALQPTSLSSARIRALDKQIKDAALFSARLNKIRPLQTLKQSLSDMLAGRANLADAKFEILKTLDSMGYDPLTGFGEGELPVEPGSLRDFSSDARRELQLRTLYRSAAFRGKIESESDLTLFAYPAWELLRVEERIVPRGQRRVSGQIVDDPGEAWRDRWQAAGGDFYDGGRMIAKKDHPVWQELGDGSGGYDDTLGQPYPPFAFNSGMSCVDIGREEALNLGVITPDEDVIPPDSELADGLRKDAADIRKNDPSLFDLIFSGGDL
jgi:hypothetical protein